ncbi:MAG: hypothetical protein WDN72_09205 [Alphaproteobacteria bacterium]
MKMIFILVCMLSLSACMRADYDVIGKVDQSQKTVAMAPGGSRSVIAIKHKLREQGWTVLVLGNSVTSEVTGSEIVTRGSVHARYTLDVKLRQVDTCITGEAALIARAVLVDNKTNAEVFTYSASACEDDVAANITDLMNGTAPSKPKFSD